MSVYGPCARGQAQHIAEAKQALDQAGGAGSAHQQTKFLHHHYYMYLITLCINEINIDVFVS
jgi:hypothetical protein